MPFCDRCGYDVVLACEVAHVGEAVLDLLFQEAHAFTHWHITLTCTCDVADRLVILEQESFRCIRGRIFGANQLIGFVYTLHHISVR